MSAHHSHPDAEGREATTSERAVPATRAGKSSRSFCLREGRPRTMGCERILGLLALGWLASGRLRRRRAHGSHVVVEAKLVRMGPQPHRGDLLLALVLHPMLEDIGGEDVAAEEEVVVGLEGGKRLFE